MTAGGCSNAERIQRIYDEERQSFVKERDETMRAAERTPNPEQNKQRVWDLYLELGADLRRARDKALSGDIEGAQRLREQAWEKVRNLIPGIEDLKPFYKPTIPNHIPQLSLTLDVSGYGTAVPEAASALGVPTLDQNGNAVYIPAPSEMMDYSLYGTAVLADAQGSYGVSVSGDFNFTIVPNDEGFSGRLNDGEMSFYTGNGWITLTPVNTDFNFINIGGDGQGAIETSLKVTASDADAAICLPVYVRLRIPITQTAYGWRANFPAMPLSSLAPKPPNPIRDYNKDGLLDFASDYAAFMVDYNAHAYFTDRNGDGTWTQADVDRWIQEFNGND
ncbi:MAG: hypothetical protein J0L78_13900 [Planctomycetes bacterium]|nr:hypothetical protein [Planctomycetota bacterium]